MWLVTLIKEDLMKESINEADAPLDGTDPGEWLVIRHSLGLTAHEMAHHLSATEDEYLKWETGHAPMPHLAKLAVQSVVKLTAGSVKYLVEELRGLEDPVITVYSTDDDFHRTYPESGDMFSARWWSMVAGRAQQHLDGKPRMRLHR